MNLHTLWAALPLALATGLASAQLVRPDSATASSTFSSSYDIGNAIDGSGLPAGFTLDDTHAAYARDNHWTTRNGAIAAGTANATFFFDTPQTIAQFHLWNHQSNGGLASNGFYAVTQFDLRFFDADNNLLGEVLDVAAVGGVGVSAVQSFALPTFDNVSSVYFGIDANSAPLTHTGVNYTGVAEVAFSASPIPEASTSALLTLGLLGLLGGAPALRRRMR
jgi:hypothetical protein